MGSNDFYASLTEMMDTVIAVAIGLILSTVFIITLFWIQDPKSSCFGRKLAILLKQLRNIHETQVTSVYALFIVHKILLSYIMTGEPTND
jgi:hypothetical protein